MQIEPVLTNFIVSKDTRKRFDGTCRFIGRTRTSVLVELMEQFVIQKAPEIAKRNSEIEKADKVIQESNRILGFPELLEENKRMRHSGIQEAENSDFEPASLFFSDGQENF